MKKLLAVLLVLCLLPCALAEDLGTYIYSYNLWAGWTNADHLPESAYSCKSDSYEWKDKNGDPISFEKDENSVSALCLCYDESHIGEFLRRCVALAMAFDGNDDMSTIYFGVLSGYLHSGYNTDSEKFFLNDDPTIIMSVFKMKNDAYAFLILKYLG